jgi:meso-butanediol dehydrogenase/(S,S)-butanediol dehydrogenase/diacetyl reductase
MKVAIVTGAARGIGLATTKQLLAKGWRVSMVDWDQAELTNAASGLSDVLPLCYDI